MENYHPTIGTPIEELDTPVLLIDLDVLERNFETIAKTYASTKCKLREHGKNIKSPVIALKQIKAGGTVGGVCSAKVSEAEVMVEGGIRDILITNQIVTSDKMLRACALARQADVKVAVDDLRNVRDLSRVAVELGVTLGIVVEVDTSMHRAGVRSSEQGVEIARLATQLPGLVFKGVMSHQTLGGRQADRETRAVRAKKFIQMCVDVKDAIEAAGIPVDIVSSGETFCYDIAPEIPGVTEVQGGTYALMSATNPMSSVFGLAGKILITVCSAARTNLAVGDVGYKALACSAGALPSVEGMPGVRVRELHEDFVVLGLDTSTKLAVGQKLVLRPALQDVMVNRWDQFVAVRRGVVEAVWDIPGRGCFN